MARPLHHRDRPDMIELLNNCAHGKEVYTYLVTRGEKKYLRKTSHTIDGTFILDREARGWEWYQARRYPPPAPSRIRYEKRNEHSILEAEWIEGSKGLYTKGLGPNAQWIEQAIMHYREVWPRSDKNRVPLHGDFSLDNILFNSTGTHVIDWEHFAEEGGPWGFDALYLLFETLWSGMKGRSHLTSGETRDLRRLFKLLDKNSGLIGPIKKTPLKTIKEFIRSHQNFWGSQLEIKDCKLPVLLFSEAQTNQIDALINCEVAE